MGRIGRLVVLAQQQHSGQEETATIEGKGMAREAASVPGAGENVGAPEKGDETTAASGDKDVAEQERAGSRQEYIGQDEEDGPVTVRTKSFPSPLKYPFCKAARPCAQSRAFPLRSPEHLGWAPLLAVDRDLLCTLKAP